MEERRPAMGRTWWRDDPRGERIARGTGIAFVVLAVIAYLVAGQPDSDATGDEILQHFADNDDGYEWQAFFFGLAGAAFLWFFGTVAAALRRAEGDPAGRIPAIVVTSAATSAGIYFAGVAAWHALARFGDDAALFELGSSAFALANFAAATLVFAVGTGIGRTRLLDEWMAWLSVAVALLIVVNGCVQTVSEGDFPDVLAQIAFFAFLVWTLILSGLLTWRREAVVERRAAAVT